MESRRDDAAAKRMVDAARATGEPERNPNLTAEVAGRPADEKRAVAQANDPAAGPRVAFSIEGALYELTFPATKDRIIAAARASALEQTERFKLERLPDTSYPDMESLRRAVNAIT